MFTLIFALTFVLKHCLKLYLIENKLFQEDFAKMIGKTQGAVSNIIRAKSFPPLDTILKIEKVTNGKVNRNMLLEDYEKMRLPK